MAPRGTVGVLLLATMSFSGGCTLVKGTLQLPDRAIQTVLPIAQGAEAPDPVEVQASLIRFSDHYLNAVARNIRKLQRDGKPISPRELTRRRINYTNQVLAITTGSNAFANLLDMIVLVTVTRSRVESHWLARMSGSDAGPVQTLFKDAESEIWRISSLALTTEQQTELRGSLGNWLKRNPSLLTGPDMTDSDLIGDIRRFSQNRRLAAPTSVFNLLMIDPLSGLDPAARELAETRLMAERALFLSRHLPELIRWETEYLTMNTMEVPEVTKLLADTSKLSASADRFSQLAAKLPELIANERTQLVSTLQSQQAGLTVLATESKNALMAGKQMADSADATLKSFQAVVAQLEAQPSDPNAEPFRIADYTAAAQQIALTSARLAELLASFNQTLGPENLDALSQRVDALTRHAQGSSKDIVDYAYRKALTGSALIFAMALSFGLAYQFLGAWARHTAQRRWRNAKAKGENSLS